jgi:hypothetical protein
MRLFRRPDQVIQPFHFGDSQRKATCLWLRNLPALEHWGEGELFGPVSHVAQPKPTYVDHATGKRRYFTDAISGTGGGEHARSKTFTGIADAMAAQWGSL